LPVVQKKEARAHEEIKNRDKLEEKTEGKVKISTVNSQLKDMNLYNAGLAKGG